MPTQQPLSQRLKEFLSSNSFIGFAISIVTIAIVSWLFFWPDAMQGNELRQHDMQQGYAIGQEAKAYQEATGETTRWTNSLFSGMPTFQISPSYPSSSWITAISQIYSLWFPSPVNLVFIMMVGFYILLMSMKVKWYLALPGAIAYGFSSYFIIIIGAGHIWKFVTLAYIPPTIAGIVLCYRGKFLSGSALAALFAMLQIASNHIQMTYYFLFVVVGFVIAYAVTLFKSGKVKRWCKGTVALAIAALLAVAANSPSIYNTYEYSKETMRGSHSELSSTGNSAGVTRSGGLDKAYITAWSYGKSETFSLLIPNIKGGATIKPEKGDNKLLSLYSTDQAQDLIKSGAINSQIAPMLDQMPQYFGDQPMTNGPVYVGAMVIALFILGCIIVKGSIKWTLLVLTIISIALSWGHNLMWLTDWMIDNFPMYNKFRTVASILVIAEFTIPLLAILALKELLSNRKNLHQYLLPMALSFGSCLLICLLGIISPSAFGSYLSAQEQEYYVASGIANQYPDLFAAIESVRMAMVSSDALRSFIIIAIGGMLLFLYYKHKVNTVVTALAITTLITADLYSVNKRYLNTDSFVTKQLAQGERFPLSEADKVILSDTTMNYRVMDIPRFYDAAPSYHHKAIGGYHAAKLTRYQDLIDRHLGNFPKGTAGEADINILNMLNARYVTMGDRAEDVVENPEALGNAWLVDKIIYVDNADQEMDALSTLIPDSVVVSDVKFKNVLGDNIPSKAPGDTIYETSYAPNHLTYQVNSHNGGLAVFSEIYFPWGWKASIDGQNAEIGRVNYVLRALRVPAGSHTVTMTFDPESLHVTTAISYIAIIIIYIGIIGAMALGLWQLGRRKDEKA